VAEIIRAGIESIDKGQTEAGRSLGLNGMQTMGYIVLPQAVKNILPALGNEFIVLIKRNVCSRSHCSNGFDKGSTICRIQNLGYSHPSSHCSSYLFNYCSWADKVIGSI